MKVSIMDEVKEVKNTHTAFEQIEGIINDSITNSGFYLSHMNIDGVEIFTDYEFYIEDHLSHIENIKIEVKSTEEFADEILTSIYDYAQRAVSEIKVLSEAFYHSPSAETWGSLHDLIEAIQWMHEAINSINNENKQPANWNSYLSIIKEFESIFPNLMEALETKDSILTGDILQYEIAPVFDNLNGLNRESSIESKGITEHA